MYIYVYYDVQVVIATQIIQKSDKVYHVYNFPFLSYTRLMALL